jgi:hypothetical protein
MHLTCHSHTLVILLPGKELRYPLFGTPQFFWALWRKKHHFHLLGIEPKICLMPSV